MSNERRIKEKCPVISSGENAKVLGIVSELLSEYSIVNEDKIDRRDTIQNMDRK